MPIIVTWADLEEPPERTARGVTVVHSPDALALGRVTRLEKRLTIGRLTPEVKEEPVGLALDDPRLSRHHCTLLRQPREGGAPEPTWRLRDEASKNGTFVDGVAITERALLDGDAIRLGRTVLLFGIIDVAETPPPLPGDGLISHTPAFRRMVHEADRLAPGDQPVLLIGEPGTGKTMLARRLHELSGRPGAFVSVDCGAGGVPDPLEIPDDGTLFLHRVDTLPASARAALLHALDIAGARIVATATASRLPPDLRDRLGGAQLHLPPLRARRADIPLLAKHFLTQCRPDRPLEATASWVEALVRYAFPGNIAELRSLMETLAAMEDRTTLFESDLPAPITRSGQARSYREAQARGRHRDPT